MSDSIEQRRTIVDPEVTGNAQLLLGYVAGSLMRESPRVYAIVAVDPGAGHQTVEHRATGNRYRISVVQIEGSAP